MVVTSNFRRESSASTGLRRRRVGEEGFMRVGVLLYQYFEGCIGRMYLYLFVSQCTFSI